MSICHLPASPAQPCPLLFLRPANSLPSLFNRSSSYMALETRGEWLQRVVCQMQIPIFCCCFPWRHLWDLCGVWGWGLQPFLHRNGREWLGMAGNGREWLGMAAGSCLLLNIYDAGSLAAPHPPRVDFVLPSGIAEKHCSFSRPWQGWQLGWACMRASLLCKATSEWPMVGTKGSSLSRRFPHPCLGDFLFLACSSGALCAPLQWDQCWGGLSGGSG